MSDIETKLEALAALRANALNQGARRYAAADRTDPFSYRRAVAHIANGVGGHCPDEAGNVKLCYDAEGHQEKRSYTKATGETVEYSVMAWRNMARP